MYIEPKTNIKLLADVPLDSSYNHTLFFSSASEQYNTLSAYVSKNLTEYSYQRVNTGIARVGIEADEIYNVNYMMFQNSNYGKKWFYAFVKKVHYINNGYSEIEFEIDVIQTWFFECQIGTQLIERQHSRTDGIGDNIAPENLAIPETITNKYNSIVDLTKCSLIISVVANADGTGYFSNGGYYNGVYSGSQLFVFEMTSSALDNIKTFLSAYISNPDSILSMYLIPTLALSNQNVIKDGSNPWYYIAGNMDVTEIDYSLSDYYIDGTEAFGGASPTGSYTPKNKKLYTYPYNYLSIDNASGSEINLRYEFFPELKPQVRVWYSLIQPVVARLTPKGYKNCGNRGLTTESLDVTTFPMCSWAYDAFAAWVVQQGAPLAVNTMANVAQVGMGANFGASASASGLLGTAINALTQTYQASIKADNLRGNLNTGCNYLAGNGASFNVTRRCIDAQTCKRFDDFFSRFGYALNQIDVPNRSSRPHWNYVKTIAASFSGSVPADDMHRIEGIYNSGITFWKKASEVGNYALDNSI